MFSFITSLTFLFGFAIFVLVVYGFIYFRDFSRSTLHRRRLLSPFLIISVGCLVFLWVNINAPLSLRTFTNLDHHFLQQDGFEVNKKIVLGQQDAGSASVNQFLIERKTSEVVVSSEYAEDPFFINDGKSVKLVSASFPLNGQNLFFHCDSVRIEIGRNSKNDFQLILNGHVFTATRTLNKGLSVWNLFRDCDPFVISPYYFNQELVGNLKQIYILRNNTINEGLSFFLAAGIFKSASDLRHGDRMLSPNDLHFTSSITDGYIISWGMESNKNQYILRSASGNFTLMNRFPVSYPVTAENKPDFSQRHVNKFLSSGGNDLLLLPPAFREGFLFPVFGNDNLKGFKPVLMSFTQGKGNEPLALSVSGFNKGSTRINVNDQQFSLPSGNGDFKWLFSSRNSFNWQLGSSMVSPGKWKTMIFGSLLFFIGMVLAGKPSRTAWVWQLLSCITLVMLTTRFFLYWRYKSFPPFEGLDPASVQQLNSFWNFGVIVLATILLGILFGPSQILSLGRRIITKPVSQIRLQINQLKKNNFKQKPEARIGLPAIFLISWIGLLLLAGGYAAFRNFDTGACRHLSIALLVLYFIYLYISYKYSPLVKGNGSTWWKMENGSVGSMIVSNPVKVLLSITLLGVLSFIDIGFSIIFLNFLLFNEAFLCINYAIAGLSAGSKKNATFFAILGTIYLLIFILNLLFAPYLFHFLLELPQLAYNIGYILFGGAIAWNLLRIFEFKKPSSTWLAGILITLSVFSVAFVFFPREKVLAKAAMTRYRIDVQIMPVEEAITRAYEDGKTYEPVIRAAQNQWFINTFIQDKSSTHAGFNLLPHAPQQKGAKYNAQATDLVASRFFIAEHGKMSIIFFVFLLLLPTIMLASFYKLYPDFTNRVNVHFPSITTGFSVLNYLMITALLVILAATGKYIFFGQDLPFASILSKQSMIVPAIFILVALMFFSKVPQQYYSNKRKWMPGLFVFGGLMVLILLVKPMFNKSREFGVSGMANNMDHFIENRLQPLWDHFDTSRHTRKLSIIHKDALFSDSLRSILAKDGMNGDNQFFVQEAYRYTRSGYTQHIDARRLLYLDLTSGSGRLAVNPNYFRIEPPPHLQESWKGNVYGDTSIYNIAVWNAPTGTHEIYRTDKPGQLDIGNGIYLNLLPSSQMYLVNNSARNVSITLNSNDRTLAGGDSLLMGNPARLVIVDPVTNQETIVNSEPDAFMKNFYVNGNRFYSYPLGNKFTWVRNFSESISADHHSGELAAKNVFVSFDMHLMDSLSNIVSRYIGQDTAYKEGAEYGISIVDGNGRVVAMVDLIKGFERPDPNDKADFNRITRGEGGFVSQALLRKQIGNINLLRLNPGPGSTLKPIIFAAIAAQLNLNWESFSSEGFSSKQKYFGGEKVAEYDFEKNNGRISRVVDYLKYSDNYYHSNLLLLGSYPKQEIRGLLSGSFVTKNPGEGLHWPNFNYNGSNYFLPGFEHWPGYENGRANFGSSNSFLSLGLLDNFGIYTSAAGKSYDRFDSDYDSLLFLNGWKKSGFILPEYSLFDQQAYGSDHRIPYDLFTMSFRGHVKGSSQVLISPLKMAEAMGKLVSQNRNYELTLNPYAKVPEFLSFVLDENILYNDFLSLMKGQVFRGMKEALYGGTASRLGTMIKNGAPWFYFAKTGTTGDNESTTKSKLFSLIISSKDISHMDHSFRNNPFYTIYFTSQNGPAKQNEELQAALIDCLQNSRTFKMYMKGNDQ